MQLPGKKISKKKKVPEANLIEILVKKDHK